MADVVRCGCFTGHRHISPGMGKPAVQALKQEIHYAAQMGITRFYAGGALGFDTLAALTVLEMRKTIPRLELYMAIPFSGQESRWAEEDRELYRHILSHADHVDVLHKRYETGCYHERNRFMVDQSELCIAYLLRRTGGTFYTCCYAQQHGCQVHNLAEQTEIRRNGIENAAEKRNGHQRFYR